MLRTVILCDDDGNALDTMDLVKAHTGEGHLHRAFSVYVFTPDRKKLLIQKRSAKKMLWPLVWANTCCSHPFENEQPEQAGERRLEEELGFTVPLSPLASFVYRAQDPTGRGVEHEYVTILTGETGEDDETIDADPNEVALWRWIEIDELQKEMAGSPLAFAPWFHLGLKLSL